jgi:hypothetical protein
VKPVQTEQLLRLLADMRGRDERMIDGVRVRSAALAIEPTPDS